MRTRLLLAACALSFVPAAPACAQRLADAGSSNAIISNTAGPRDPLQPNADLWTRSRAAVHVSQESYVDEDGVIQVKHGVVAVASIARNANVGVGLYKVTPYSPGDIAFRRMAPDGSGPGRIAAVGLRIGF